MNLKPKILFVCNQGKNRSRTAEEMFKGEYDTRSASLYNPEKPVMREMIEWADTIVVFEDAQAREIEKRFPKETREKQVISLDIPDVYDYNVFSLVEALRKAMDEIAFRLKP